MNTQLLINVLKDYLNERLSGRELLQIWSNSEFDRIYYNLCHLVADEDIRAKDDIYRCNQMNQLRCLINGLETGVELEELNKISFL